MEIGGSEIVLQTPLDLPAGWGRTFKARRSPAQGDQTAESQPQRQGPRSASAQPLSPHRRRDLTHRKWKRVPHERRPVQATRNARAVAGLFLPCVQRPQGRRKPTLPKPGGQLRGPRPRTHGVLRGGPWEPCPHVPARGLTRGDPHSPGSCPRISGAEGHGSPRRAPPQIAATVHSEHLPGSGLAAAADTRQRPALQRAGRSGGRRLRGTQATGASARRLLVPRDAAALPFPSIGGLRPLHIQPGCHLCLRRKPGSLFAAFLLKVRAPTPLIPAEAWTPRLQKPHLENTGFSLGLPPKPAGKLHPKPTGPYEEGPAQRPRPSAKQALLSLLFSAPSLPTPTPHNPPRRQSPQF